MIGATVVGNPAATVITSSPSLILFFPKYSEVKAEKASKLAAEQKL